MNGAPTRSAVSSSCAFIENPPSPTAASTGTSGRASFAPIAALRPYAMPDSPFDIQNVSGLPARPELAEQILVRPDVGRDDRFAGARAGERANDVARPHRARRAGTAVRAARGASLETCETARPTRRRRSGDERFEQQRVIDERLVVRHDAGRVAGLRAPTGCRARHARSCRSRRDRARSRSDRSAALSASTITPSAAMPLITPTKLRPRLVDDAFHLRRDGKRQLPVVEPAPQLRRAAASTPSPTSTSGRSAVGRISRRAIARARAAGLVSGRRRPVVPLRPIARRLHGFARRQRQIRHAVRPIHARRERPPARPRSPSIASPSRRPRDIGRNVSCSGRS